MQFQNPTSPYSLHHGHHSVEVNTTSFTGSNGTSEHHIMLQPVQYGHVPDQLDWLSSALDKALADLGMDSRNAVFRRFFCSDLPNQISDLNQHPVSNPSRPENGAVSWVNQPPAPPAKICLWVYCIDDPSGTLKTSKRRESFYLRRGQLEHVWTTGISFPDQPGSYQQSHAVMDWYQAFLEGKGMTLRDNCIRTWFYVKDVDTNYGGLVSARNEVFAEEGLNQETHYIASTGIEGSFCDVHALVMMDAYAIRGIQQNQVEYLNALDHLSHTHLYGVAFERGTAVHYKDRKHVIISGTASIDANGQVLHEGDVLCQLDRTLENINALLDQADASMEDMMHFIVYLRDSSDAGIVRDVLKERIGDKPFMIVYGPVCRPNWLIEIEGLAVVPARNPSLPAF